MSTSRIPRVLGRLLAALILLFALVIALAPAKFTQVRNPLSMKPEDAGLVADTITFPSKDAGINLKAWWIPAEQAKATLLFVHGGGSTRSLGLPQGLKFAADMRAKGYNVLVPDLRNHGESDAAPDGQVTFGTNESHDVIGAVDEALRRAPGLPVGAVGWSMGGNAVIYAAAQDPRISVVVADDTFAYFREILPGYLEVQAGVPGLFAPPLAWSAEHLHDVPLHLGRAEEVIAQVAPRPILLVRNDGDPVVPADHVDRLAAAATSEEVWRVAPPPPEHPIWSEAGAWATHVCTYRVDPPTYVAKVGGFLDAHLVPPPPPEAPPADAAGEAAPTEAPVAETAAPPPAP